jgi:DNA-binding transcriptional regulator YdaS (Cro superfamily)
MATKEEKLLEGVARALQALGTGAELARRLGTTRQAVQKWRRVPEARVLQVERVTGVPRYMLRPDLFDRPTKNAIVRKAQLLQDLG